MKIKIDTALYRCNFFLKQNWANLPKIGEILGKLIWIEDWISD
jgi:hypothetical protein